MKAGKIVPLEAVYSSVKTLIYSNITLFIYDVETKFYHLKVVMWGSDLQAFIDEKGTKTISNKLYYSLIKTIYFYSLKLVYI